MNLPGSTVSQLRTTRPVYISPVSVFTNSYLELSDTLLMRLLRLDGDGDFSLVDCFGKNILPYAVLSHTWD